MIKKATATVQVSANRWFISVFLHCHSLKVKIALLLQIRII